MKMINKSFNSVDKSNPMSSQYYDENNQLDKLFTTKNVQVNE